MVSNRIVVKYNQMSILQTHSSFRNHQCERKMLKAVANSDIKKLVSAVPFPLTMLIYFFICFWKQCFSPFHLFFLYLINIFPHSHFEDFLNGVTTINWLAKVFQPDPWLLISTFCIENQASLSVGAFDFYLTYISELPTIQCQNFTQSKESLYQNLIYKNSPIKLSHSHIIKLHSVIVSLLTLFRKCDKLSFKEWTNQRFSASLDH